MAIRSAIENMFIQKLLEHVLDGNKGSNILTAVLLPLLGAKINWALALQGYKFEDLAAAEELAKVLGLAVVGMFGYFVGRKKKSTAPATAIQP